MTSALSALRRMRLGACAGRGLHDRRCASRGYAGDTAAVGFAVAANAGGRPDKRAAAAIAPSNPPASPAVAEQHKLPPDSTTKQTLELPGRTLSFTATAGSIRLFDDKGEAQADIAYTSYQLDGADRASRPVTFLFNGGPGSASAWLQLGSNGPWRLAINADQVTPSTSPDLQPNAETWLDFTDLVYIDPVGTGYSRFVATGDDVRKKFYSVDGDVASVAVTIRRWLEKHDRLLSPKYIAGESYGGIRGPKLVNKLQTDQGVGVKGLILISPVLDFREYNGSSILQYVASLPTFAAVAREAKGQRDARRSRRCREICARRFPARPDQGRGRRGGQQPHRRQGRAAHRHRPGGQPQARRAFRGRRISPRVRPPQRQGHRTLRRLGDRLRSVSGFALFHLRRSLRRYAVGVGHQRRGRSHQSQAELAARRLLRTPQLPRRARLGFRSRHADTRNPSPSCARRSRSIRR